MTYALRGCKNALPVRFKAHASNLPPVQLHKIRLCAVLKPVVVMQFEEQFIYGGIFKLKPVGSHSLPCAAAFLASKERC
jgi:hypothetical protein